MLDRFPVVFLDMNGTFMFGEDRFGPDEDFAATYRTTGGGLPAKRVEAIIRACYHHLEARYVDPAYHECFPTVAEALRALPDTQGLDAADLHHLEHTFAVHECGHVPPDYAQALHQLAAEHRLGLIADVWSPKALWLAELERAGVLDVFEATVFSSDIGCVKPSPRPFAHAMNVMGATPQACVMIGDSVRRDVGGATAAGLAAIWIGSGPPPPDADGAASSLLEFCLEANKQHKLH